MAMASAFDDSFEKIIYQIISFSETQASKLLGNLMLVGVIVLRFFLKKKKNWTFAKNLIDNYSSCTK